LKKLGDVAPQNGVYLTSSQDFFAFYMLADIDSAYFGIFFQVKEVANGQSLVGFQGSEG
jgi:hypothetical protein